MNEKLIKYSLIAAAILAVLAAWVTSMAIAGGVVYYMLSRHDSPSPSGITQLLEGHPEDAARVADITKSLADVLEADKEVVKTTSDVRQAITLSGQLAYGEQMKGKYPGLAKLMSDTLRASIGDAPKNLDDELRAKAVQSLRSMSDAAKGAM